MMYAAIKLFTLNCFVGLQECENSELQCENSELSLVYLVEVENISFLSLLHASLQ